MGCEVEVDDGGVTIRFTGLDRLLALSRGLHLAPVEVTGASLGLQRELRRQLRFRVGGSAWPGGFINGWYTVRAGSKGERQLWDVYRDPEVLVIDTSRKRPRRVVLQHPDRRDLAQRIDEVRKRGTSA